jgi:hypothetical protein
MQTPARGKLTPVKSACLKQIAYNSPLRLGMNGADDDPDEIVRINHVPPEAVHAVRMTAVAKDAPRGRSFSGCVAAA